jgi:CYTH domain-containing protein
MDINHSEPTIILDKAVGQNPAKTDRYIIQIAQRAIPKLINKVVRVILHDKEALHTVPEKALGVPVYEFEVNFSEDEPDEMLGTAGTGGYPGGGDAYDS